MLIASLTLLAFKLGFSVLLGAFAAGMLSVLLYPMLARVRLQRVRDREEAPGLGFHPVSG